MYDSLFVQNPRHISLTRDSQIDGDGNFDSLTAMGFKTMHSFDEVSCDADTMRASR